MAQNLTDTAELDKHTSYTVIRDTFAHLTKLPSSLLRGEAPYDVRPYVHGTFIVPDEDVVRFCGHVDNQNPPRCHRITGTYRGVTCTVFGIPRGQG